MSIEQEIQQNNPFHSSNEKAIINVIYTNNWLYLHHNKLFKKYSLSMQQYNVLRILNGQKEDPLTINGIIDRMLDKMSNASRLVDKLFLKDYVTRVENKADRRACDVAITPAGIEALAAIEDELKSLQSNLTQLSEVDADKLSNLLDVMRGN
ncbi:MAG: MarR family transcriptional regulator [Spirosomataceae bacterium]